MSLRGPSRIITFGTFFIGRSKLEQNKIKANSWMLKHQPKTLDGYIWQNDAHKTAFTDMITNGNIPTHLLLSGVQGTGKTTIADILIRHMPVDQDYDVKRINASDENSVDDMRNSIKSFVQTYATGKFKIVLLDEADGLSVPAQKILRGMMDEFIDVARFVLTCNYDHRIIPMLKSRCMSFKFKSPDPTDVALYIAGILSKENVKTTLDVIDKYVAVNYPDIRKIVQTVQQHTVDGSLASPTEVDDTSEMKLQLLEAIENGNWQQARREVCASAMGESDWEELYVFLYTNINKSKTLKDSVKDSAIVLINEHMDLHTRVADPEINAAALFIRLSQVM